MKSLHANKGGNQMLEYWMPHGRMKNHDPLGLIPKHFMLVGI